MSTPPSAQPPPQNKPRKKRSADVVSFEDLLAAHKTEREPGQLPPEGVVLIGVDLELQRRMAERIGLATPTELHPVSTAPNAGATAVDSQQATVDYSESATVVDSNVPRVAGSESATVADSQPTTVGDSDLPIVAPSQSATVAVLEPATVALNASDCSRRGVSHCL